MVRGIVDVVRHHPNAKFVGIAVYTEFFSDIRATMLWCTLHAIKSFSV